ncbi:hypothetical protein Q1695_012780 [Nippostrongylus brasiliensis]|nr:hypothetical protein Q1695_012780 [Nippostrongylus brasiliensis]
MVSGGEESPGSTPPETPDLTYPLLNHLHLHHHRVCSNYNCSHAAKRCGVNSDGDVECVCAWRNEPNREPTLRGLCSGAEYDGNKSNEAFCMLSAPATTTAMATRPAGQPP